MHVERVPVGQDAKDLEPGDLLVFHRRGLVSFFIRLGEKLRNRDAEWSHMAVASTPDTIIEALTKRVTRTPLENYRDVEYGVLRMRRHGWYSSDDQQVAALSFAQSCVGQRYGWVIILGIALRYLTPGRGLWFGMSGVEICSGLSAQTATRGWANFPDNPASMTPQEVVDYFEEARL